MLQMKGLFRGLSTEDPHDHIWNFMDVWVPFSFKNITQELIRLCLFPFFIMGEATKWLDYLPRESITSWEELTNAFYVSFFPPSNLVKLRDNIQNFKWGDGETIYSWDMVKVSEVVSLLSNSRATKKCVLTIFLPKPRFSIKGMAD